MREVSCPYCHAPTPVGDGPPGAIVDCPACDRSFALVTPGEPIAPTKPAPSTPVASGRRATPGDVRLLPTGAVALAATALFYLALVTPLHQTVFGQLFGNRGWVPYVISFLAAWSLVILAAKYRSLARQTRTLERDLLPATLGTSVTPDNALRFLAHLRELPAELSDTFLTERLARALLHFEARRKVSEVVDQLTNQSQSDENAVESSYTMLRVFIWAIPILGFIGTVIGIGAAVGGFSESVAAAADVEVMKNSIGSVTTGLGVAFDTTLLALVVSIFIMFPTSSLQKAEEDYLARVDDYCDEHLVRRLDDGGRGQGADDEFIDKAADRLARALLARLDERLPPRS